MTHTHKIMIPLKIITKEEAERLGFTRRTEHPSGDGGIKYAYGVTGNRDTGEIVERFRIHKKTGKKEILFETKDWKKFKEKKKLDKVN